MLSTKHVLLSALILSLLLLVSCRDEDQQPPENGGGIPQGMTRLYGTVRETNGQPISGVALHVVYDFGSLASFAPMTPSSALLYTLQVLTTTCNGNTALQDGIAVQIFWDVDSDGPDETDPQPPLCSQPPDCPEGPAYTVNFNEFEINGVEQLQIPGTFVSERDFATVGDVLSPNRYYLRIYCTDGNVLWTSQVIDVPQGPSEQEMFFTCTQCEGIPEIPVWSLSQSYPNPATDSVTIRFSLEQSAQTLLTLRQLSNNRLDTLLLESLGSGGQSRDYDITERANGLYEYRFNAGTFAQSDLMLKNETDTGVLSGMPEIDLTEDNGSYRFDTAAGVTIDRRGEADENLGTAFLDHVHMIAIKPGFQIADTLIAVTSAESLNVDITLHTP